MPIASGDGETSPTEALRPTRQTWQRRVPQRHAIATVAAALALVIALVPDPTTIARAPVVEVDRDGVAVPTASATPLTVAGHPTLRKDPGDLLAPPAAASAEGERALSAPFGVPPRPAFEAPVIPEPVPVEADVQIIRPTPRPTPRPTLRPTPRPAAPQPAAQPAANTGGGGGGGGGGGSQPDPGGGGWNYDPDVSWYGPGFYGNRTACGHTYTQTIMGVAHKTLPCGTTVQFRYNGRVITVPVIDRGPYIPGRHWDLSAAACQALGHCFTGPLEWRLP